MSGNPDTALREIRVLCQQYAAGNLTPSGTHRLVTMVGWLDAYLSTGGWLPEEWAADAYWDEPPPMPRRTDTVYLPGDAPGAARSGSLPGPPWDLPARSYAALRIALRAA